MLHQVSQIGLAEDMLLADGEPCPDLSRYDECVAVCTDDVMHFSRCPVAARHRLHSLDLQLKECGIPRRPDKDLDWSAAGVVLGCDFDGYNGFLFAHSTKELQMLYDATVLLSRAEATPDAVMKLMGSMQWFDLHNRNKLSMYDSVHPFEQLSNPDRAQWLPSAARSDLEASLALAPFWCADLSREFLLFTAATDASSSFCFGVAIDKTSEAFVRKAASFAEKR